MFKFNTSGLNADLFKKNTFSSANVGTLEQQLQLYGTQNPIKDYNKLLEVIDFKREEYQKFAKLARKRVFGGYEKIIRVVRPTTMIATTQPLIEGITPEARSIEAKSIVATARSYGAIMRYTDESSRNYKYGMIERAKRELLKLFVKTEDLLAQSALIIDGHEWYPTKSNAINKTQLVNVACGLNKDGSKLSGDDLTNFKGLSANSFLEERYAKSSIEFEELWVMAEKMNAAMVPKFGGTNEHYKFFCHPHVYFDLWQSKTVEKFMKLQQSAEPMKTGKIPILFGIQINKAQTCRTERNVAGATIEGKKTSATVYTSYLLGADALERLERKDTKFEVISKGFGSSGALHDGLNQHASFGWKIHFIGFWVFNPDAVWTVFSVPSLGEKQTPVNENGTIGAASKGLGMATAADNILRTKENAFVFSYIHGGGGLSSIGTYAQFLEDNEKYREFGYIQVAKDLAGATQALKFDLMEGTGEPEQIITVTKEVLKKIFTLTGTAPNQKLKLIGKSTDYLTRNNLKTKPSDVIALAAKTTGINVDNETGYDLSMILLRYIENQFRGFFKNTIPGQNNYGIYTVPTKIRGTTTIDSTTGKFVNKDLTKDDKFNKGSQRTLIKDNNK